MIQDFFKVNLTTRGLLDMNDQILGGDSIRWPRGDTLIACFQFVRKVGNTTSDVTIPATSSLSLVIKQGNDRAAAVSLADSAADQWNISGDWSEAAAGTAKQSCRVTLTKTELTALFPTTVGDLPFLLELVELDVNGFESTICSHPITIFGDCKRGAEGTPAPSSPTYYTAAEVLALLNARIVVSGSKRLRVNPDGTYFSEDV
jgi:hypothetical protein